MARVAIALGSNLGDRLEHLRAGLAGLERLGPIVAVSRVHETEPVGGPEQGRFLNAVAVVDTSVVPLDVLARLLEIERSRGRERTVRWGPRTLDLDLIAYEGERLSLPTLEVPHPRAHERGFVLAPLAEVWPDVELADGSTAEEALRVVGSSGIKPWEGSWRTEAPHLGSEAALWVVAQLVLFALWLAVVLAAAESASPARSVIGGLMILGAVGIMEASRRALGTNLTPYPQPRQGGTLVSTGIYARVRHPIYTGVVLALGGASVFAGSIAAGLVAVGFLVFFTFKSSVEERAMEINVVGYEQYRTAVRGRFFPR
jgi:2-amino-4-hydroxy-6-hydroxymethyldihydropteridine diphosphokinase